MLPAIKRLAAEHGLDRIGAERAWVWAPYGAAHVATCADNARAARGLRDAVAAGAVSAIAFVDQDANADAIPAWVRVIRLAPIAGWPAYAPYRNRFVKWALPFLLPRVASSIYLDGDLAVRGDAAWIGRLFEHVREHGFVVTAHVRSGWRDEHRAIVTTPRFLLHDRLARQHRLYREAGLPEDAPVLQNNFVGRRHDPAFDPLSAEVLAQIAELSHRDQLALTWAAWRTGITPVPSPPGEWLFTSFAARLPSHGQCLLDDDALGRYLRLRWTGDRFSETRIGEVLERALTHAHRATRLLARVAARLTPR